jgi:hypothetical protein
MIFPNIGCFIKSGYKETQQKAKVYLNHTLFEKATIDLTLRLDQSEVKPFADWYINDINNGADVFELTQKFFGVNRTWNCRFLNSPVGGLKELDQEITIKLEIQDNVGLYT